MLPAGKMAIQGFVINLGILSGMFLIEMMGTFYRNSIDFSFLFVSIFPPFFAGTTFLIWFYAYENEPIDFCVENMNHSPRFKEQGGNNINTIYTIETKDEGKDRKQVEAIIESRRIPREMHSKHEQENPIAKDAKKAKDE
mmetsp:Transcript_31272/g.38671  ORF Transcript_31272/g.38671 Transcript_31272/m.38671 type:complete len:140 (+) Transcript_31272:420-839(+)